MNKIGPHIAADFFRFAARLLSVAATLLLCADFIGHLLAGEPILANMTTTESFMFFALVVVCIGMVALWIFEVAGASLILLGMSFFYFLNWLGSGRLPGGWVFPLLFLPAILVAIARLWSAGGVSPAAHDDPTG